MDEQGSDFNWVKARHECSAARMFTRLSLRAAADVEERNELRTDRELKREIKFEFQSKGARFEVFQNSRERPSVTFVLDGDGIRVEGNNPSACFAGTVTLNNEGQCRLKVEQEELQEWQVLKRALEAFFFSPDA
jgi:hypothetical protein